MMMANIVISVVLHVLFFVVPNAIVGYVVQRKGGWALGSSLRIRPAPWLFGLVWNVLFVALGICWSMGFAAPYSPGIYFALNLLFLAWIILFSQRHHLRAALAVLNLTLVVSVTLSVLAFLRVPLATSSNFERYGFPTATFFALSTWLFYARDINAQLFLLPVRASK